MFEDFLLTEEGIKTVREFKRIMNEALEKCDDLMEEKPECMRLISIYRTKMEEAGMFGTKAIAKNPGLQRIA